MRGSTLALKPSADVTRSSKQGYQWPHKKDLCPPNLFKKNSKVQKKCYLVTICEHNLSSTDIVLNNPQFYTLGKHTSIQESPPA